MLPQFKQTLTDLTKQSVDWTDKLVNDRFSSWKLSTANIALQAALPNNLLIPDFDENGNELHNGAYSVMVRVPIFYLDEVIEGAPHQLHPMFKINGHKYRCIYISKYQNVVINDGLNRAYSLPNQSPNTFLSLDNAYTFCKNKGKGWHLMTNAEWAGIALWCKANGFQPKGNNNYGKDVDETIMKAEPATYGEDDNKIYIVKTGTGPALWSHDNTYAGITDLNGNIWEWCAGVKLNNGEINIIKDNDAADTTIPEDWKAINHDGLTEISQDGICKYTIERSLFSDLDTEPSASENNSILLKSLCLIPFNNSQNTSYEDDTVFINLNGERVFNRGGTYNLNKQAGLFSFSTSSTHADIRGDTGFRSAYFDEADQDDNIPEEE